LRGFETHEVLMVRRNRSDGLGLTIRDCRTRGQG
jgi:hypothetical protein